MTDTELTAARSRVLTAALGQRNPSEDLVRELNRLLKLTRHECALKEDK